MITSSQHELCYWRCPIAAASLIFASSLIYLSVHASALPTSYGVVPVTAGRLEAVIAISALNWNHPTRSVRSYNKPHSRTVGMGLALAPAPTVMRRGRLLTAYSTCPSSEPRLAVE